MDTKDYWSNSSIEFGTSGIVEDVDVSSDKPNSLFIFSGIIGFCGVFIFLTLFFAWNQIQPKKVKLIKWSAVQDSKELALAMSQRLFPLLSENEVLKVYNFNRLNLTERQWVNLIYFSTKIRYIKSFQAENLIYFSKLEENDFQEDKNSIIVPQPLLNSVNFVLEIDVVDSSQGHYKKEGFEILKELELYHDPKSLKKLILKNPQGKILFSLYQTARNKMTLEFIRLQ